MNIDPKNTTAVKCEKCEHDRFKEVMFIRKVSKLLTGQTNDSMMPVPTFQCDSCGHINKEFLPKF